MWSGPLHDPAFVGKVILHVEENEGLYGTFPRMRGMLNVAREVRQAQSSAHALD